MIRLNNITLSFDSKTIFENLTFEFEDNKIYSLVGESGIGKTSLLSVISNIIFCDSGEIENTGGLSYLFQEPILLEHLTLLENLSLSQKLQAKSVKNAENEKLLLDFGLKRVDFQKLPNSSSGGMKQRVALAQTLLTKTENILLDEPFKGIDHENLNKILEISWEFVKHIKANVICVTHSIEQAILFSDEVLIYLDKDNIIPIKFTDEFSHLSPNERKKSDLFEKYLVEIISLKALRNE